MDATYTYIANLLEQIPQIPEDSIVSRTDFSNEQTKTILFAFAAGQELSEHTSTQIATLYFIEGEADLTLDSDSMASRPGTWAHMPPNLPHSIKAKTPVLMLLTMHKPGQE